MITQSSGLLELLEVGNNIMADRGFNIEDILSEKDITINIPPFLGERQQLSKREVEQTHGVAGVRIHVERAIGRVKQCRILQSVMPISLASIKSAGC